MSRTEMYLVPEVGPITLYAEFKNAFRGAWLTWSNMAKRYLEIDLPSMDDGLLRQTWNLWKNQSVPLEHRIVLASTFDNVMIRRENLHELIRAIESYQNDFADPGHLPAQVSKLKELRDNPECFAVCWNQTSVNADAWEVPDILACGHHDEYRRYDISKDTGHWFLFTEILDTDAESV